MNAFRAACMCCYLAGPTLALLANCGFGADDLATLEPGAVPLDPSYADDVAPILDTYCRACHSAEAIATARSDPYFDTEAESRACAASIRETMVQSRSMPPGAFEHPTSEERLVIVRWSEAVPAGEQFCEEDD